MSREGRAEATPFDGGTARSLHNGIVKARVLAPRAFPVVAVSCD